MISALWGIKYLNCLNNWNYFSLTVEKGEHWQRHYAPLNVFILPLKQFLGTEFNPEHSKREKDNSIMMGFYYVALAGHKLTM